MLRPHLKYYIAGPMTGLPSFNYPAFFAMEDVLTLEYGVTNVENPAKIANGDYTQKYSYYIRESIVRLMTCGGVVFLPGWENSTGARLEYHVAKLLDMDLLDHTFKELSPRSCVLLPDINANGISQSPVHKESICKMADKVVNDSRQNDYGHPFWNFTDIAKIWSVVLDKDNITPEQVAQCMIGTKLARQKHKFTLDNLVDMAGYAKTLQMIESYRKENEL